MTSFFYSTNGKIKTIENMVSIADNYENSVLGKKVKIIGTRNEILSIGEIKIFDKNNIEVPVNNITSSQSLSAGTDNLVEKALDNNIFSIAKTGLQQNMPPELQNRVWFEFNLHTATNISRILIINSLARPPIEKQTIRNTLVQILNANNEILFEYNISNVIKSTYNIYVNRTNDYVNGKKIEIEQPFSILNLSEIRIYNEEAKQIPNTFTISTTRNSSNVNSNISLNTIGSQLFDDNLDNYIETTIDSDNKNRLIIDLGEERRISRIVINNRPNNVERINGAKLFIYNTNNEIVWDYNFGYTDAPVFDIQIKNKWEIYKDVSNLRYTKVEQTGNNFRCALVQGSPVICKTKNNYIEGENYLAMKKKGDEYYCISLDGMNCAHSDYITIYNLIYSSKGREVNITSSVSSMILMKTNLNDELKQYLNIKQTIDETTSEINLINHDFENINRIISEEEPIKNRLEAEKDKLISELDNYKYGLIACIIIGLLFLIIFYIVYRSVSKNDSDLNNRRSNRFEHD